MSPTVKHSIEGVGMMGTLIGIGFFSTLGSFGVHALDRVLPLWTKDAYFVLDQCFRARNFILNPGLSVLSKCKWTFACSLPAWLVRYFSPAGQELLVYQGIFAYLVPFSLTTLGWLVEDGPPGQLRQGFYTSRISTIAYALGAFTATHPRRVLWWLVYATAPVVGAVALARVPYLGTPVRWVIRRTVVPMLLSVDDAWDQLDIWEAYVMERIPRSLTHAWSRYQQRQPRRLELPEYQYRRLAEGEIRLLVLRRPRWLTGVVHASVIHQPIDRSPDYEALSYRWGSTERTDEILIDGCRFGVTKSAYDLLMARRSVWRDRTIWIDAICINQDDDEEKGAQVQLMTDIYRRASRVVVYTGRDWRARYTAPLSFELVAAQMQFEGSDVEFGSWMAEKVKSRRWQVLVDLFTDEYFNRAWIVQEIAVAQKVEIYYGGLYIPWAVFVDVIAFCARPHQRHLLGMSEVKDKRLASGWQGTTLENITYLFLMRPQPSETENRQWDLEDLLFATAMFRATDPRDKIFGILGLAPEATRRLIKPDYTKSVEEVYERAARMVLLRQPEQPRSLHLLALAGIGFVASRRVAPSWLPDFMEERVGLPFTNPVGRLRRFSAGGQSQAVMEPGSLSQSLKVRAKEVDRVVGVSASGAFSIGAVEGKHVSIFQILGKKKAFIEGVMQLCAAHNHLWPDGEHVIRHRLWRVLVAGRMQREPIDARFGDVFPYWLRQLEMAAGAKDLDALIASFSNSTGSTNNDEAAATMTRFREDGSFTQYDVAVMEAAYGKRFAITAAGRLCFVPPLTEVDDVVVVPLGAQTPFLVREAPETAGANERSYRLVGEAYVEDCMHGELMGDPEASSWLQLI